MHVCWSSGYYIGQLRTAGCRNWRTVVKRAHSSNAALALAIRKARWGDKRARTLFVGDPWYDPNVIAEARLK